MSLKYLGEPCRKTVSDYMAILCTIGGWTREKMAEPDLSKGKQTCKSEEESALVDRERGEGGGRGGERYI